MSETQTKIQKSLSTMTGKNRFNEKKSNCKKKRKHRNRNLIFRQPRLPCWFLPLSTQALAALGYIPDPVSGQPMVNRDLAKHLIDILGILEEKTQGNLDENESALITETVHQLRMAFVSSGHQSEPDADENKGPTIELP